MDLQPWIIAAIASFAALVAYLQWRTAHQRVVLDLFDRRWEILKLVEEASDKIVQAGRAGQDELRKLHEANGRAKFLFGDEVVGYLTKRIEDCAFMIAYSDDAIAAQPVNQQQRLIDKWHSALLRFGQFREKGVPIFANYMRLQHKMH